MRELEGLDVSEGKPQKAKVEPPKPKPTEADKTEPEPSKEEGAETTTETKPVKAAELRVAYERSKETLKAKDAEIAKLQTELKAARSAPADDPEKKVLLEKFNASEKRRQDLEKEISFVAYHKSAEFVEKYQRPYEEAWHKAVAELSELTVEAEDGTSRRATAQDLIALANMPLGDARKLANQMFGDAADDVMAHRRKVRELSDAQNKALADAQKNADARDKERQTQSLQERQKMATLWQSENKAWVEKFPRWFGKEDGDAEGNALLDRGYAMADAAFSSNGDTTPEQRVKLHAAMRNRAAAFGKIALRLKQAKTRIKELEQSLADYEASEPKSGEGGRDTPGKLPADPYSEAVSELDRLGRKH